MKRKLFWAVVFASPLVMAAVPQKIKNSSPSTLKPSTSKQELYEQLAGKPQNGSQNKMTTRKPTATTAVTASAQKALTLARQSRAEKNYILAIKRYNFILKYYSKTPQAKVALMDKASMYKEMGLSEQAAYNQKRVSTLQSPPLNVQPTKKMTSKSSTKPAVKR